MENRIFVIERTEYELYQAAYGDWCVSVSEYSKERQDYNLGSLEEAYNFILRDYEVSESEEDDEEGEEEE